MIKDPSTTSSSSPVGSPAPDPIEPERYELTEPRRYHFDLERRGFIKLFGGGLLVMVAASDLIAQESGRGVRGQGNAEDPNLAAWLHIDESGTVTANTGKVELGQNIRTSLAQTVADELRVPLTSVTLVLGDTDKCPFDMGTFGSRSTPFMAPLMAKAAATAREMLIDQAASRWAVDRKTLAARNGTITGGPGGKTLSYGELTKGQALTGTIPAQPPVDAHEQWQIRGTAPKKVNGRDFVTGRHQYTPDLVRPEMVYGRIVRPDGYGGTLTNVETARASAMTGVTVVRDGNFIGVVAPTERGAARAAAAVQATWNVPADQPNADNVYEYFKKNPDANARGGAPAAAVGTGSVPGGARAFQASYRVPYIAHVPLEPRAAVAEWTGDKVTVWTATQRPWGVRGEVAEAFRIPEDRVRIIVPDFGSAYGGKHTGEAAIEAARLSKAVNKPVKLVWTRAEEFAWAYFRPAGLIEVRGAVDANGQIVLWEFDNWNSGAAGIQSPYAFTGRAVYHPAKTPLRQGSYRALAATANNYAREMHVDEMARGMGIDAVEFRMKNLRDERIRAVLTAAAQKIGWPKPSAPGRSLGIASGTEKAGFVATAAEVSKAATGFKIERIVVVFECGAIVNPDGVRNQVEGSVVQALGGALFEAIDFGEGRVRNGTLEQYRVPRFRDVPPIDVILLDRKDLPSAGAGECSMVCVAPAIGSAVRGLGKVDTALPIRLVNA